MGQATMSEPVELRTALAAAGVGIWRVELPARIVSRDHTLSAMLGLSPLEAREPASDFFARFHPDDRDGAASQIEDLIGGGGLHVSEHRIVRPDGSVRWIRTRENSAAPDGGPQMAIGVAVDVTNEKSAELQRDLFLGVLGHDLRTPLNVISLIAQSLPRQDPASELEAAGRIVANVNRMNRLIQQIMDFARVESQGLELRPAAVDLPWLAREVAQIVEAAHPGSTVLVTGSDAVIGEWDADRLEQVLQNLLVNAVTHGEAGAPVEVRVRHEQGSATIEVENRGKPIPEHVRPTLFDPFRRAAQRTGGVGLGLYITRKVLLAHGGDIGFTSDERATVFRARLPLLRGVVSQE